MTINGRHYRLKKEMEIRLQGIALALLGIMCRNNNIDGVAILFLACGIALTFGKRRRVNDSEAGRELSQG